MDVALLNILYSFIFNSLKIQTVKPALYLFLSEKFHKSMFHSPF